MTGHPPLGLSSTDGEGNAVQAAVQASCATASYATDGTDFTGVVRHYYGVAWKRFLTWFVPFAALWPLVVIVKLEFLLPLAIIGIVGAAVTLGAFWARVSLVRKCSRVFRSYSLEFRGPVKKVKLVRPSRLYLSMGGRGAKPPVMLAKHVLGGNRWPTGIANGVWFAGDEPFGGAAIVPGSGELLFMQPSEWAQSEKERQSAGAERLQRAKRAGIEKPVSYR